MSTIEDPIPESVLQDIQKDYSDVQALLATSESDLNESYCARLNSARNILKQIVNKISSFRNDHGHALRGALWIAHANIDSVSEEVSDQEASLRKAFTEFQEVGMKEMCVLQEIEGLNQLGWLWINRACYEEGKRHLEAANTIYKEFYLISSDIHSLNSLINPSFENPKQGTLLETANLCTVCALANANQKLGLLDEAAEGCLYALDKQLELDNYDPMDWCQKALDILSHLTKHSMFLTAKKYLAIAFTLCSSPEVLKLERQPRMLARAQVMWGKLCLAILERTEKCNDREVPVPTHVVMDPEVMNTPIHEVSSLEEALKVFTIGENALNEASKFFSLEDHCVDYINIVHCSCAMLKVLIKFENSPNKQFKLYRRQVESMEPVIKVLNPSHYMEECRTLWMESARVYEEMLRLKEKSDKHRNILITLAIKHYTKYVGSFNLSQIQDPEEGISVIVAYLHMGKLYGKYGPPEDGNKSLQCQCECYRIIRNFCQKNPNSSILTNNNELIREMLEFIDSFFALNLRRS